MLNTLSCKISLDRSPCYAKIALLIFLFSLVLLFNSSFIWPLKAFLAALLSLQLMATIIKPIPHPKYKLISQDKRGWLLHSINGKEMIFNKVRIIIDTGLFFLLELSTEEKSQILVIFLDQISEDNYRLLNINTKIA